ncbi:LCP family protein [Oerskovia jenensis]|uniref:LCP family protein required for cell wall assembly n=1 Tax=Oerskovia jenensis TaxID=162169 RepID=A0ABS2LIX7_9CELL|nr:LCP family protein [Oerskovia jenensis]MBM7480063.1 LCP family protein required for cell wall assembly [Oerskovia jenensis]
MSDFELLSPADPPTPSPDDRRPGRRRARAGRRGSRTALVVLGALVAVICLGGFAAVVAFRQSLDRNIEKLADPFADLTDRPAPAPTDPDLPDEAVNILVLGSDSRISAGDPSQWKAGAQRTDAIMLVHLPADRKSAQVVSFPRDSWVPIPGHGEAKINAAFSYGGPALMIETVEQLTGVRIDHFALTDFTSFTTLTDALGGVLIRIPEDIGDGKKVQFAAGVHNLSGEEALAYTRQRHGLANGDFGRAQRQQNWMRSILAKVNNNRNDVPRMTSFFTAFSESVAVDEGFTMDRIQDLYLSARGLSTNDVTFLTAPHAGTGRSADGQSIVVLDRGLLDPLMASFADDTSGRFVEENKGVLAVLPPTVK